MKARKDDQFTLFAKGEELYQDKLLLETALNLLDEKYPPEKVEHIVDFTTFREIHVSGCTAFLQNIAQGQPLTIEHRVAISNLIKDLSEELSYEEMTHNEASLRKDLSKW